MSISAIGSGGTNVYYTNLEQAVQDQATLEMNPSLAQTISQKAESPPFASGEEALGMLTGTGASQSSLISLSYSMQLMQSLSASGTLTNNTSLTQALLQNYTNPTDISSGSVVNTSA
ncbi:MAG: hypothetical protein ACP5IL_16960 [Syntrophobacteraceae bacterium]